MQGRQSLSTGRFGLAVTLLAIALGLGGGCGSSTPSTSGCEVDGQYDRVVGMDDTTLGYSALDVVNAFAANGDGLLHWFDGTETILQITATVSQGKGSNVTINASPSDPKYCAPSMSIEPVSFTVSTADGRLAESMVSRLVAIGRGAPTAVWPALAVFPDKMQGTLTLPAEWTTGYELQSIELVVNSKIDTESPYCLPSDKPDLSTTSTEVCTAWSGKLIYRGNHLPGDARPGTPPAASVQNVVGWWSWQ